MAELVRSEIKLRARESMKGKLGFLILSWIIFAVITGAVGWTGIGFLLLTGPLTIGLLVIFLSVYRGEEVSYNNLFDGFKSFLSAFLAFLLVTILTVLWSLLFIVPGIIACIRYSQTFYILRENPGMDGNAAIQKSKAMMQGHKGEYFLLGLSFILWILLGIITVGIAFLWIGPYMSTTYAGYYDWLKKQEA
ncbi:MAG: DUF975 family protein [Spirochaetota bacterium]